VFVGFGTTAFHPSSPTMGTAFCQGNLAASAFVGVWPAGLAVAVAVGSCTRFGDAAEDLTGLGADLVTGFVCFVTAFAVLAGVKGGCSVGGIDEMMRLTCWIVTRL
jgi:hypothetical protein